MALGDDRTGLLKTTAYELAKQYITYDAQNRPEYVYTAHTDAVAGTPCTRTQYVYADLTSVRITKRRETPATWLLAYDV